MIMKKTVLVLIACALSVAIGAAQDVNVIFQTPSVVRIVKGDTIPAGSYSITASPEDVAVRVRESASYTTYTSSALRVRVDNADGKVSFMLPSGKLLLGEGGYSFTERTEGLDKGSFIVRQTFLPEDGEDFYGLGIIQEEDFSLRGKTRKMIQGNTDDYTPVVQSIKGYGILWDNPSPTLFSDGEDGMSFESEVGDCIDYYFIYGGDADGVIASIRDLTGHVPMLPLWSYGFMQSRERYKSSAELLGVLERYRAEGIPVDCMVQDWQYWGSNYLWNAMDFLNEDFQDAQRMIDRVHELNSHLMISVWSSFGPQTLQYRELEPEGLLLDMETWPQSGLSFWPPRMDYPSGVRPYDPFSPKAREIYWKYLSKLDRMGVDAWWLDSTEPDHFNVTDSSFEQMTADGSLRRVRNAFPIVAVEGVYDAQRAEGRDARRVVILTRSAWTGQQRTGANTWSGDVQSNWDSFRRQVPAGLRFALTGNPNFNTDLGGFFANAYNKRGAAYGSATKNPRFQELYVRWTQYGVFSPMMRSHGTEVPREIYLYGKAGEPVYDALVGAVKLRYSLLPYIYSTAWQVSSADGTFQRALIMDFASDPEVSDMGSEFMFGDALLVAPVLHAQYTDETVGYTDEAADFTRPGSMKVYLPGGTGWYDFYSSEYHKGGRWLDYTTSFDRIPVFVREGSIVPIGPDVQYSGEKPWDDLELRIYAGASGEFTLYEDEGDGYDYEKGEYSTIRFTLKGNTLEISDRQGGFDGMLDSRSFRLNYIRRDGTVLTQTVDYDGHGLKVKLQ